MKQNNRLGTYFLCFFSFCLLPVCSSALGPNMDPVPQPSGFPGYYVGGKLGSGIFELDSVTINNVSFAPHNDSGLAGGLYAGYRFKPYVALEIGYDLYTTYHYNADIPSFSNASTDIRRSVYDFDVLARLIAPFSPVYATLAGGLAVVLTDYQNIGSHGDASFARPKLELGLGLYVTRKISLGLAFSRIFAGGDLQATITRSGTQTYLNVNPNQLPNIDLATFNVTADL